jgi:hypothetical protein
MRIKIKVEALPLHFVVLGGLLVLYSIFNILIRESLILNSVLLLVGIVLITTQQMLEINTDKKSFSEYYWLLGLKLSNYTESYSEIIYVECTTANYSQEYGKYNRRFISGTMFKGHIELKDQDNIYVGQNKSKSSLLRKLTKISTQLRVPVEDKSNIKD